MRKLIIMLQELEKCIKYYINFRIIYSFFLKNKNLNFVFEISPRSLILTHFLFPYISVLVNILFLIDVNKILLTTVYNYNNILYLIWKLIHFNLIILHTHIYYSVKNGYLSLLANIWPEPPNLNFLSVLTIS